MTALLDGPRADESTYVPSPEADRPAARASVTPPKRRPSPGVRPRPGRPSGRPAATTVRPVGSSTPPSLGSGSGSGARPTAPRPLAPRPLAPRPLPVAHRVVDYTRPAPIRTPEPNPLGRPGTGHALTPRTLARPARRPTPHPAPHPQPAVRRLREWLPATWHWRSFLVLATLATWGLHLWRVDTSVDLFIDEPFYAAVGQSIARGGMPYATGSPFFLHPPGFFLVEAGWMRIFGGHADLFAQVFSLRRLVAAVAALTALMLGVLVNKVVGRTAAVLVVGIYLVNAFANGQSSLVILEPITLLWTISGYAVFAHLDPAPGRRRQRQIVLGSLLFGVATISKEFAVFVTLMPLAVAFVLGCWLTRREAVRAMLVTCVPWTVWFAIVGATGYWSQFFAQVTSGFHRTTGKEQISGFNRAGAPSFLETIIANLGELWTTYAILGLGSIAIVYVFWISLREPRLRFLSLFGVCAIPLLAYCVLLGTNEEQFFNFLFFPALICLVTVACREWHRLRRVVRFAVLGLLVAATVSDAAHYTLIHTRPDNGTYLIDQWMAAHVPVGTAVGTTNPVQREIFLRYAMVDDVPNRPLDPRVEYLVVFDKQVDQGYAFVDRATVDKQVRGQRIAFSTTDRSNGRMVIYAID